MSNSDKQTKEVGYGHPPKSNQFKPKQSGNPKGRPKKSDPSIVDLDAILTTEIPVNGNLMDSREVELRQQVKKALEPKGSLKSMRHVIDEFEKHGAMKPPKLGQHKIELPPVSEVPWAVQLILLKGGNAPPWSKTQLQKAKAAYLETRNEGDRIHDVEAGYEEWLKI